MREILFRGQTRKKGEKVRLDGTPVDGNWVYGGVAQFNEERAIIYQTEPEFHKFPVYADTVGVYRGLTDKDGVRVFQGDICRCKRFNDVYVGEIVFNVITASFVMWYQSSVGAYGEKATHKMLLSECDDIEVIGNVHDNPELLKGE